MALLILRESNNATRCAGRCPNPQCRPALHGAARAFATPHLSHVTMPHACGTLALRPGNIPMPRRARPSPASDPQHPPVLSRDCSRSSETKNRFGLQLFCDCGLSHGAKTQIEALKRIKNGIFQALREQRRVRNRKKVAKMPSFLFLQWVRSPQRVRSCENAQDIMADKLNSETRKAPAMRTPPEKPILLESTLPWHRTARNKHRARLSAYRRSLLRPVPHGCTEAR